MKRPTSRGPSLGLGLGGDATLALLLGVFAIAATFQIGAVSASRTDDRFLSEAVETDAFHPNRYWHPALNTLGVQCGGTSMKTGDGGQYRCFTNGQGICRNNDLGSFGPGQWTLGIVDRNLTLYTPSNQISWQFCSDVTHLCIGEDHGTDNGQWYSQERPYMFFYDEKTHTYVGELTCDDIDGQDGENIGKPTIIKMNDLSHLGQYVDYGEDGITVTKFRKGQTEDPLDNNALFELLVEKDGDRAVAEGFYNPFKCYWTQECRNCGAELYEEFEFTLDFDLFEFCAKTIPLPQDVADQIEAALLTFLNQDAACADLAEGVVGCVDEVYLDIEIIFFENSNETCGTTNGTDTLRTSRMLWEDEEDEALDYPTDVTDHDVQPGLIRGATIDIDGEDDGRKLQRIKKSRRSRGRARGRGRCRRCKRRTRNSRKLQELEAPSQFSNENKPFRRSLQQADDVDLHCPPDLAKILREQNSTFFENVTVADVFNFTYLENDEVTPPSPGGCIASFNALEAAIDDSNCPNTPTLELCPGTIVFTGDISKSGKCFSLTCPGSDCTLDVNGFAFEFFNSDSLTFSGVTFKDSTNRRRLQPSGPGNEDPPCIAVENQDPGATLNIENSVFIGCSSDDYGGAIYASNAEINIKSTVFRGCRANVSGGAIDVRASDNSRTTIDDCTFEDNEADYGGAAYVSRDATILNSVFVNNMAFEAGGAIDFDSDEYNITGSSFTNNTACRGGAIENTNDGTVEIRSTVFKGNEARLTCFERPSLQSRGDDIHVRGGEALCPGVDPGGNPNDVVFCSAFSTSTIGVSTTYKESAQGDVCKDACTGLNSTCPGC